MKKTMLFAVGMLAAAALAAPDQTTLEWDALPPDQVRGYVVEWATKTSTYQVSVGISTGPTVSVVIPVTAYGTAFRVRGTNEFGMGPWSATAQLPGPPKILRLSFDVAP